MSNYVRGPWVKSGFDIVGANGKRVVICEGLAFGSKSSFPEAQANSDLIMAAPELLEALEILESTCGEGWLNQDNPVRIYAREIIAKAKGE